MINTIKLNDVLADYKKDFLITQWKEEKFKWQAVQHFQKHWDINTPHFLEMFMEATAKTSNLLAAGRFFPRRMIQKFAESDMEATRAMFIDLFDEHKDLAQRVDQFRLEADKIREKHDDGTWKNHFQTANSISTYLWLRYPDKYYIYKFGECRSVAKELDSSFMPKKGADTANLVGTFNFYNQINAHLVKDQELIKLLQSVLDDSCYPDPMLRTLTMDVGFYISRVYAKRPAPVIDEWFPADYSPNISVDQWLDLLGNKDVFTQDSLEIMKRMKDYGGMATCTELAVRYGKTKNFYNVGSSSLARRVARATGCSVMAGGTGNAKWWPILYVGKYAGEDTEGSYIWKLRDELSEALDNFDLDHVNLYAKDEGYGSDRNYWWLTANPRIWSFSDLAVGEVQSYTLYNERGNKRRIFQNFLDAKAGDLVVGYESTPALKIVALGSITDNDRENLYFEKAEGLPNPIDYGSLKDCPELANMEFFSNMQGSLFKLTRDEYDFVLDLIREENPLLEDDEPDSYPREKFLEEVYMVPEDFDTLVSLLKNKKNLILEGPPGVGKTFAAKRIAYAILGEKRESNVEFIQFHQSYSYEDFVMGYKPRGDSFELEYGIFHRFCQKAANKPNEPFFFIIDEINRGNMSKIFGELLMLIEKDYRETKVTLAYDKMPFSVPKNVYIIGMMNTADRSLAMIDYALRRRFSFYEMKPGFVSEGFKKYLAELDDDTLNVLIKQIQELNKEIIFDRSLGKGFCIGHSYFCNQKECTDEWMRQVIEHDILPMLSEYWFDEESKFQRWENILLGVLYD